MKVVTINESLFEDYLNKNNLFSHFRSYIFF